MRSFQISLVLGLLAGGALRPASAGFGPLAFFEVRGTHVDIPLQSDEHGWFAEDFEYEGSGWGVQVHDLRLESDPFTIYSVGVYNATGAPQAFLFSYLLPMAPIQAPIVSASISGQLTDAVGNGISVIPDGQALLQQTDLLSPTTNAGVDVGPAFAAGPAPPGTSYPYGPFNAGPQPGPVNPGSGWTGLQTTLSFLLSDDPFGLPDDSAEFHGFSSAQPIPEPATAALLGAGLLGLLVIRRRKGR